MNERDFKAALAQFVQEHMPWPYEDVDRYDAEANDTAWAIAEKLLPAFSREFAEITDDAAVSR